MTISIIAAVDKNLLIGDSKSNSMPWGYSIPEDLKFFQDQTLGQVVVYGKKTYESMMSKPLSFRTNIILTNHHFNIHVPSYTKAFTISSVDKVLNYHDNHLHPDRKMFICGGSNIYEQFLETGRVDEIIFTHIGHSFEGDVYFPMLHADLVECYKSEVIKEIPISENNHYHLTMKRYTQLSRHPEMFSDIQGKELI